MFAICLFSYSSTAQTSQKELLIKKWKYIGKEEFGVVKLDSIDKADWIQLNTDGTFERVLSGKEIKGTWLFNEAAKIIALTSASKKTLNYNLKKVTSTDLIIEYQTPDLIRTKYRFVAVSE
jgi:hypothetical protein